MCNTNYEVEGRMKIKGASDSLVSIIIPIYNVELYLSCCIESVIKQTYKNIQIILVNDGSTDNCLEICNKYMALDSRVEIINQENKGLSAARNSGLANAKGEYVYFLDSDDFIADNAIKELYKMAKENNLEAVLLDGYSIDESGNCYESEYCHKFNYKIENEGKYLFAKMTNNSDYRPPVQFLFIRKDCLMNYGLSFYEGILHEDELFTFLLFMKCNRTGHLAKPLYYKRQRNGSIMSRKATEKNFTGCLCVLEEMVNYYRKNKFEESIDYAIKKHIASFFEHTYKKYISLSQKEKDKNIKGKKQMIIVMKKIRYLNDWRFFIKCRFRPIYNLYKTIKIKL